MLLREVAAREERAADVRGAGAGRPVQRGVATVSLRVDLREIRPRQDGEADLKNESKK